MAEKKLPKALREYLSEIGRKGGSATSEAKQKASRKNAKKYRTEAQRKKARAEANKRYYEKKQQEKK